MDWIALAFAFVLIGAYSVAVAWLGYKQGKQAGQVVAPQSRVSRAPVAQPSPEQPKPFAGRCVECHQIGTHHPGCPEGKPKVKTVGQRFVGFSRIKKQLEREETA